MPDTMPSATFEQSVTGVVNAGISASLGGTVNTYITYTSQNLDDECLKDLRLSDPQHDMSRIQQAKGNLLRDSYSWIFGHVDFHLWRDGAQCKLLWISGDPGKGKTMLLCGIINELEQLKTHRLSYFFCQAEQPRQRSATAVLRGLIYRLAAQQPSLILPFIIKRYKHSNKYEGKTMFEDVNAWVALSEILLEILDSQHLAKAILVIDALDECIEEFQKLVKFIAQASSSSPAKWIVSSRNLSGVKQTFSNNKHIRRICLEEEENQVFISASIQTHINDKVQTLMDQKHYDEETKHAVQQFLTSNANDSFLWVALVCNELAIQERPAKDVLKTFPPGLNPLYRRIIQRICESHNSELCKSILAICTIAYRPIMLVELNYYLNFSATLKDDEIEKLIKLCGSILELREGAVYLAHQSAKDFLITEGYNTIFPLGMKHVHYLMFRQSLQGIYKILRRDIYNVADAGTTIDNIQEPQSKPLAPVAYSCLYWAHHFYDASNGKKEVMEVQEDIDTIYAFLSEKYIYWLEALGLLRGVSKGVIALEKLRDLSVYIQETQLAQLIFDAHRFILSYKNILEIAPLQIYTAALLFSPRSSPIKKLFKREEREWVALLSSLERSWDSCLQTLEGHSDMVRSVAISPDGQLIASGSSDNTIRIWDINTGVSIRTIDGHTSWVTSVVFSRNGQHVASGSRDGTVKIWNQLTGTCLQTLKENCNIIVTIALSPDTQWVASGSDNNTISIWDTAQGSCLRVLKGHLNTVTSITFSKEGNRLMSTSYDKTVRIWDTRVGNCLQTFQGHDEFILTIALSEDNKRIASGSGDRTIKIWDIKQGKCIQNLRGHSDMISSVAFQPNGKELIASGAHDNTIKIWEAGTCRQTFDGHSDLVTSVAFSPDGRRLVSGSKDKLIKIWEIDESDNTAKAVEKHRGGITSIVFSKDNTILASGSWDKTIKLWETATGECLRTFEGHRDLITSVAFSPNNRLLASGSYDKTIRIWDVTLGEHRRTITGHDSFITSVAFPLELPNFHIASGSDDKTIKIWSIIAAVCIRTLEGHDEAVRSITFLANRRLASGSDDRTVKIWDTDSGACTQSIDLNRCIYQLSTDETGVDCLYTNIGRLDLDAVNKANTEYLHPIEHNGNDGYSKYSISPNNRWILRGGNPIIWLPPNYKASASIAAKLLLAIGCETGYVLILKFRD